MPRRMNRSDRTSITSIALSLRATRIARHSWLNSSSTLSMRYLRPSWVRSFEEVIGPDMIALLRPQPDARTVGQPEPAALGLLMGDLQPLTLDPLVVDCPARLAQQFGDLAAMKNRRPSEKHDEYPQARQLSPPSSSGWYMDVLCTTTPLGVLNSRGDLGIPSRLHSAKLLDFLP